MGNKYIDNKGKLVAKFDDDMIIFVLAKIWMCIALLVVVF